MSISTPNDTKVPFKTYINMIYHKAELIRQFNLTIAQKTTINPTEMFYFRRTGMCFTSQLYRYIGRCSIKSMQQKGSSKYFEK